ncbi:MAG: response regulator transcription factor [Candidatus Acidiferrum sp.]
MDERTAIYVVDDDASVRDAVSSLLKSVGLHAEMFGSTEEFMRARRPEVPSCLVLDIRLPRVNGLQFQEELAKTGREIPIIFITAHGDVPMTRQALKAGAVDFLTKPFQKKDLLAAIEQALERDRRRRQRSGEVFAVQSRMETLTSRELEVLNLVVAGMMNKEAAARLSLSEITVKVHRGRMMQKMQAQSLAELVRMTEKLNVLSH